MQVGDAVIIKDTGRRALITATLPESHFQLGVDCRGNTSRCRTGLQARAAGVLGTAATAIALLNPRVALARSTPFGAG
jgi:hypothetical protein